MKHLSNKLLLAFFIVILSSCESTPQRYKNVCDLMDNKISWYKAVKKVEHNSGVPKEIILAFIKQESSFNAYAKPQRPKLLGSIPWFRDSSAYGFSQAKTTTWNWYKDKSGKVGASRTNFYDSADFVAWYILQTNKMNDVRVSDVYNQYLAYHEGHTGFKNKSYQQKPWLMKVAKKVARTAKNYKNNLKTCQAKLDNTYSWSYF